MLSLTTMIIKHNMFESIETTDNNNENEEENNPLRIMFTKAMLSTPSVIVIKDLDILAVNGKE
jgi:hypothetical protein